MPQSPRQLTSPPLNYHVSQSHITTREVIDTTALLDTNYTRRLKYEVEYLKAVRENHPEYGREDQCTGPYDKPFIMLPPCWWELGEGMRMLEGVDWLWLKEIKDALEVLKLLFDAELLNAEEADAQASSGIPIVERKLFWLKKVKDELLTKNKKVLFVTDNPFLRIRSAIGRINTCSVRDVLDMNVPNDPWQTWSFEGRSNENVLIVDEKFLSTNEGARLLSRLTVFHGLMGKEFHLFLTKEVQEFAQSNQLNQADELTYPFTFAEPKNAYLPWYPESRKPKACELAKTDRQYLDHQAEYMSALTGSIGFERDFGFFCIGEPYGVDTDGGINLEQIPHTSKIFVVSDDKEWSDDIRAKVESCRRGSRPESLTMETAFKEFDWTGKPTLHDDFLSAMEDDSDDEGETVGISTGESAVKKMKLVSEENMNQSSSSDGILPAASNGASGSLEQISCIEQSGSTDGHADGISTL